MDESQLIEGCKNRDNDARKYLYEHYARKMFGLCLRYTDDYDAAQDVLQDGFLKIYERIHGFSGQGSLEGWMKRIFVNTAVDHIRKQKNSVSFDDVVWKEEAEEDAHEASEISSELSADKLFTMIKQLPKGYATAFNLLAVEGFSSKDVAQMMQISEGGVRSQYARARKLLKKMIQEYQNQIG